MELKIKLKSGQEITTFPTRIDFKNWPVKTLFVYHGKKVDQYNLIDIIGFEVFDDSTKEAVLGLE